MSHSLRLGVLTGGGDCPGLNALIRGVVKRGTHEFGHEFVGIENGYVGLMEPDLAGPLTVDHTRGAGKVAADLLARHIDAEIRVTVLGHLQRGGSPTAADRLLATRYGCKVLDLIRDEQWQHMVALRGNDVVASPLALTVKERKVEPDGELVRFTRSLGISFGDA